MTADDQPTILGQTDPAKDYAELLLRLQGLPRGRPGFVTLAEAFNVEAGSSTYYWIISKILFRGDLLKDVYQEFPDIDGDLRQELLSFVSRTQNMLKIDALQNDWNYASTNFLTAESISAIRTSSTFIRQKIRYNSLSEYYIKDTLVSAINLISEMTAVRFSDDDYIRVALISGLQDLCRSLNHFEWAGIHQTWSAYEKLASAKVLLDLSAIREPSVDKMREETVTKVNTFFGKSWAFASAVSEGWETGKNALEVASVMYRLGRTAAPIVAGLLTSS